MSFAGKKIHHDWPDADTASLQVQAANDNDLVIVNTLPQYLSIEDAELMLLEIHIGDIIAVFANDNE